MDVAGAVLLECEEGCSCKPRQYSLRHWNRVSLVYWKPLLEVSLRNGTDHCTVRVTNPLRNASETKLKVRLTSFSLPARSQLLHLCAVPPLIIYPYIPSHCAAAQEEKIVDH